MCGIAGLLKPNNNLDWENTLITMGGRLAHRGPDDSGHWFDPEIGVGLSHRRLSIIDLAPTGHQPMQSHNNRYVIVFNGEVYNHRELRTELENSGVQFKGNSDTEVMLSAISCWGLDRALARFIGMFAFALWDKEKKELYLVRDRLGVKPLYYTQKDDSCIFASELKAFTAIPGLNVALNPDAAYDMLRLGYVPGEQSIFSGIKKLLPGHLIKISLEKARIKFFDPISYWSMERAASCNPDIKNEFEAKTKMASLIENAVGIRMEADVPLGAFLSGGIDSTLVTAAMQRQASTPVKTFSIGFSDKTYDEACDARRVAEYLGTEHHELYVSEKDMLDTVSLMPEMYDEPFADPSQIPTSILSRLTREHVTVSLSGDGGDELCAGYTRHFEAERINRLISFPLAFRKLAGQAMQSLPISTWDRFADILTKTTGLKVRLLGDKLHKLGRVLGATDSQQVYELITSSGSIKQLWNGVEPNRTLLSKAKRNGMHPGELFVLHDMIRYLPDDVLTKVDRATMAYGLEAREPLLDHRLVELSWRIPFEMKVRDGKGKWLLRKVLSEWVPEQYWNRPKMGFSVPIGDWMKGALKEWAEYHLLDEHFYKAHGLLNRSAIEEIWHEHQQGSGNNQYQLWNIMMFHAWHDRWVS